MGLGHPGAVLPFLVGEDPGKEPLSLAVHDAADTLDLDHVRTEADKDSALGKAQVHGFIRAFISRTASSIPVKSARLRMLWPMLSSLRWGSVLTSAMLT